MQPSLQVTSVSVAAPDPRELAAFYSDLLGWPVTSTDPPRPGFPPEDGWAQMRPPDGDGGPTLNFEFEAGYVAPVWPSVEGQQQLQTHLDIAVNDLTSAVAWAQQAGATLAAYQPQDDVRVMLDPVGHRSACSWRPELVRLRSTCIVGEQAPSTLSELPCASGLKK